MFEEQTTRASSLRARVRGGEAQAPKRWATRDYDELRAGLHEVKGRLLESVAGNRWPQARK